MTNTIILDTGFKTIKVSTTSGVNYDLVFNPSDILFVERLHKLYGDTKQKAIELEEYQKTAEKPELDENGFPLNIDELSEKTRELNNWFRGRIDELLGEKTSQNIFGDAVFYGDSFGVYVQLITKLIEFVEPIRVKKIEKYTPKKK